MLLAPTLSGFKSVDLADALLFLHLFTLSVRPYELVLKKLVQLDSREGRFELSGIVKVEDHIYVISDNPWDRYLYEIGLTENSFSIIDQIELDPGSNLGPGPDFEGVDYCSGLFYLINENGNQLLSVNTQGAVKRLSIDYSSIDEDPFDWLVNAGYEGVALDCENEILYLARAAT